MTVCEAHAFGGELVDLGGVDLASVAAQIRPARVVKEDEENIGSTSRGQICGNDEGEA